MIILGIDLGKARTGVAVCDRAEMLVFSYFSSGTTREKEIRERWRENKWG